MLLPKSADLAEELARRLIECGRVYALIIYDIIFFPRAYKPRDRSSQAVRRVTWPATLTEAPAGGNAPFRRSSLACQF
jgi:hypothetical protein